MVICGAVLPELIAWVAEALPPWPSLTVSWAV